MVKSLAWDSGGLYLIPGLPQTSYATSGKSFDFLYFRHQFNTFLILHCHYKDKPDNLSSEVI